MSEEIKENTNYLVAFQIGNETEYLHWKYGVYSHTDENGEIYEGFVYGWEKYPGPSLSSSDPRFMDLVEDLKNDSDYDCYLIEMPEYMDENDVTYFLFDPTEHDLEIIWIIRNNTEEEQK